MSNFHSLDLSAAIWDPHPTWKSRHAKRPTAEAGRCASEKYQYGDFLELFTSTIGPERITIDAMLYEGMVLVIFMGRQYELFPSQFHSLSSSDHSQTTTQEFIHILENLTKEL